MSHGEDKVVLWHDLFDKEINASKVLSTLLMKERTALEQFDVEVLSNIMQEKKDVLSALASYEQARQATLSEQGAEISNDGMLTLIKSLPAHDANELEAKWQTLKKELHENAKQNTINGKLISATQQSIQKSLQVLLGHEGEPEGIYDQSGKVTGG